MTSAAKWQLGVGLVFGISVAVVAYRTPQEQPATAAALFGPLAFLVAAGLTSLVVPNCPQCQQGELA